jgi:hypothetical protein
LLHQIYNLVSLQSFAAATAQNAKVTIKVSDRNKMDPHHVFCFPSVSSDFIPTISVAAFGACMSSPQNAKVTIKISDRNKMDPHHVFPCFMMSSDSPLLANPCSTECQGDHQDEQLGDLPCAHHVFSFPTRGLQACHVFPYPPLLPLHRTPR